MAVIGFVAFLWFADYDNTLWHRIMVKGWSTRSVSISTFVLRIAVDLQAGIAGAMLAALVLESCSVRLRDVVKVSTMRAGNPQPRTFLDLVPAMGMPELKGTGLRSMSEYRQAAKSRKSTKFSSTALLSDLRLGQLPGLQSNKTSAYDFLYDTHGQPFNVSHGYYEYTGGVSYPIRWRASTWTRNPPAFPAFAEYSEPAEVPAGVDDTGVLLRAFLPLADAESREAIRNYTGTAMVLDSRVSCQSPHFLDVSVYTPYADLTSGILTGNMRGILEPSTEEVPRLWTPGPIPFDCSPFVNAASVTICQIGYPSASSLFWQSSGSLSSEFSNLTHDETRHAVRHGLSLFSLPMLVIRSHSSPIRTGDRLNQQVTSLESEGAWTKVSTPSLGWSVSLCYSAWDTADLEVNMYSAEKRSEPILHWTSDGYYTVPDVHHQLGETDPFASKDARGILQLARPKPRIPNTKDAIPNSIKPFVKDFADLGDEGNLQRESPLACSPCSALLLPPDTPALQLGYNRSTVFAVDYTLSSFFHQALGVNGTGSVARAMSSLITTLSSMAYYDQMPQFEKSALSTQVYFTTVLFPQSRLGFWAVAMVLALHMGLVSWIALSFAIFCRNTLLGNYWHSVAQLLGPETKDLFSKTRAATDKDVKLALTNVGQEDVTVGLRRPEGESTAKLRIMRWQKDGSSPDS
ncbi:uncharacterized protein LTR77_006653 [Saxophila tyrrhenica]|uniref:Uncharacterized protein n=1 Tax=Saxophila tyrrhenica TaxID=1690608 RepID=A0AAV9P8D9_9PEZI|nr:hypothetical protein LTR77_006653 [Saxophila tyrrhenica]